MLRGARRLGRRNDRGARLRSDVVPREKPARRISVSGPDSDWIDLLAEVDQRAPADRFEIELAGHSEREQRMARLGPLISRGYSYRGVAGSERPILTPRPSVVLSIVSLSSEGDGFPAWISLVPDEHFRQCLVANHTCDEDFARLSAACAGESWHLDSFVQQRGWAEFVVELIGSREIDLVQVINSPFGVDMLPTLRVAYPSVAVAVDVGGETAQDRAWFTYVTSRYGNVVDAFITSHSDQSATLEAAGVSASRIHLVRETDEAGAVRREEAYGRLVAASIE
jgi:hypothetical protein